MNTQDLASDSTSAGIRTFTFINATSNEVTLPSKRSAINSHIATVVHRRRQRKANLEVSISTFPLRQRAENQPSDALVKYCAICSQGSLAASSIGTCQHIPKEDLRRQSVSRIEQNSVLTQGNSDPFNSCKFYRILLNLASSGLESRHVSHTLEEHPADLLYLIVPIKVDATVNYLLDFARTSCIPQVVRRNHQWSADKGNKMPHRQPPSRPHEVSQDLCLGYLFLARYAALAASLGHVDRRIDIACMRFKGAASALLRTRLTNRGEMSDMGRRNDQARDLGTNPSLSQVCWLIYLLSTVELSARNYQEAAIHTKMILNFLYSKDPSTKVVLRLDVINAVSFWDIQRASITLTRPCFDPDRWAADYMRIPWEYLVALQAPARSDLVSKQENIDDSTAMPNSPWPFAKIRESRSIARTLLLLPVDSHTEEARLHFSVWNNIYEAKLLNDIIDLPKESDSLSALPAVYLACLYWLRRSLSSESAGPSKIAVAGTTLYDAGPVILRELNAILDRERGRNRRIGQSTNHGLGLPPIWPQRSISSNDSHNDDLMLRLWVLYVAAMLERATIASARPQKFAIEFLMQARAMRYASWRQVRDEVLKKFLYDEELDPTGDSWFDTVAGTPLRQLHFF